MLVDDNEVIIDLYERTIENISDAEVVAVAKNGEEAIEILENNVNNSKKQLDVLYEKIDAEKKELDKLYAKQSNSEDKKEEPENK